MLNDAESLIWELCDRLVLLGAGRDGCRILSEPDPYLRWRHAWDLGRHDVAAVRNVGKAIELVVERGHDTALSFVIETLRTAVPS